jgi:hypothetical protein
MPLQNRVTPFGEIVFSDARGTLMGNRGCLHDDNKVLGRRRWATQTWVTCLLSFGGRRRELMRPGYYTELFFLDEVTALAAGHRPCAECRREAFREFVGCWDIAKERSTGHTRASELDRALHLERVDRRLGRITYTAVFAELPDGAMVSRNDQALLKWDGVLRPWTLGGYKSPIAFASDGEVTVLTPRPVVEVLHRGYRPEVHPSIQS